MKTRIFLTVLLAAPLVPCQESRPQLPAGLRLPSDWDRRDLEGRWVYYQQDLAEHSKDQNRRTTWAALLGARRDFELLEWIGVFEGWHFAGGTLVQADAPQWIRVAVWNLRALDSHNLDTAMQTLLSKPALVLGWFEKYPSAQRGKGSSVYAKLREKAVDPVDPGDKLPPLDGNQVLLPFLDVPGELQEFGARTRAEPGVRYVHQIVRALHGLSVWGEVEAVHVHKVMSLTRHENRAVREEAFTTLTRLPGHLVPHEELLAVAEGGGPLETRRLAMMAFSHGTHPRVWLQLHRVATDGEHPCQGVALERLADLGNGFTVQYLKAADGPSLGFQGAAQARGVVARIEKRIGQKSEAAEARGFRAWLERVAWAEAAEDPLRASLARWTERALQNVLTGAQLLAMVEDLEEEGLPGPAFGPDESARVEPVLRRWLLRLKREGTERVKRSGKD